MSIIGEAFVKISPESAEFATKTKSQLEAALSGVGGVSGALGAAAVVGVVAALGKIGEEFANSRHQIQQETGATGEALDGLANTVKRTFAEVPASLTDVTTAVDELTRRGVPLGHQLDALAKQELFLAKITKEDLGSTVESTTALFAKFNVPVRDQSRELDVLFKGYQQSGKSLNELVSSLQSGGAALGQFGFSLDESIALVAGLEKAGVNVQPALAALRKSFGQIAKEGGDPKQVLHDIIDELTKGKDPTKAMADAIKLFGARGGVELATAIKQGKLSVQDLLKTITDGKGGIDATGEATLSLGDKIKLFKNQALVDLEPIGTAILNTFEKGVEEATPVLQHLGTAVADLVQSLLPVVEPVGAAIVGTFELALPAIDLVATGIDTIASALGHVPGPVVAVAGAVGGLAIASQAAGGSMFFAAAAGEALGTAIDFLTGPVGITLGALAAIGALTHIFASEASPAEEEAKKLGQALFDASSGAGAYAGNIKDAADGTQKFIQSQIDAGKDNTLQDALDKGGSTVTELVGHLSDGADGWKRYAESVAIAGGGLAKAGTQTGDFQRQLLALDDSAFNANKTNGLLTKSQHDALNTTRDYLDALNQQHDAFVKTAQDHLRLVATSGELTGAQLHQIEQQDRNKDGTIDYGKVLDDVARTISDLSEEQNKNADAASQTKQVYADLVDQLAQGTITAADAGSALEGLGFTADGAKAKVADLQSQIKSFVSAVSGQLPGTADAVKSFADGVSKASSQLATDQAAHTQLMQQLAKDGGKASKSLADQIHTNNDAIHADFVKLVAAQDPEVFVKQLTKSANDAQSFFTNIRKLVAEGFGSLAGQLIQLGPQAAAGIAQGLVSDKAKATQANAAATLLDNQNAAIVAFAQSHFSELNGIGVQQAQAVTTGIATGFSAAASKVSPQVQDATRRLAQDGAAAFNPDLASKTRGALTGAVGVVQADGSIAAKTASKGTDAANAFKPDLAAQIPPAFEAAKNAIVQTGSLIKPAGDAGHRIGMVFGDALAQGITDTTPAVAQAASNAAAAAEISARARLKNGPPSKVALDIGRVFGTSLASGISETEKLVRTASASLATAAVEPFSKLHAATPDVVRQATRSASTVTPLAVAQRQAPAPGQTTEHTIKKETTVKVDLHKVDPPDPHDLANEIAWRTD